MRSSKSRSRGNKNRNVRPSGGNVINRVFDSSGPDGKVRGTPQQIIEKYNQLHRDAQLSGDRVNAENFAQHAEHYTRMLAEAMREVEKAREEQEQQNRERQAERDRERNDRLRQQEAMANTEPGNDLPAFISGGSGDDASSDSDLVETPEAGGARKDAGKSEVRQGDDAAPKPRRSRGRRPRGSDAEASAGNGPTEAAE
ncbi:MAG: DUF4167 domain-containing protein [Limimaricola sp.]|uniref:DUF4167 domain-containing protein n=1 Tax=Limimaricola sp. TaxID=2211665 RepID=UPI001DF81331|nr:DUF4167 domain-containing protein [Limimaricola sp.]MBI1418295.1 DUF4167 domain-containing protein [Limimaricola sp.]